MKKILFLYLLLSVFALDIQAKTIHWLTFIDTTDADVGEMDQNIRNMLYSRWIEPINATLKENGYTLNVLDVYGSDLSPQNCKMIVNGLRCDSEDIIVFYYVGHGTENTSTSDFPLMWMGQGNTQYLIPLSWVHETLKDKGARLTITIGMCCNARQNVTGRVSPSFALNYGNSYVDEDMSASIKKMFLNYSGDLIVTSASPSESSWGNMTTLGLMDYFTLSLLDQFNIELPNKSNPNWESMLSELKEDVQDYVANDVGIQRKKPGATQTPIWVNNLVDANSPKVTPPDKPKSDTGSDKVIEVKNFLNEAFAYISSTKVDATDRIKIAEELKAIFSSDLIVKIISQDGNLVVDKEPISNFLGRICTSSSLLNVAVVDLTYSQSRGVTSLQVRETYRKR